MELRWLHAFVYITVLLAALRKSFHHLNQKALPLQQQDQEHSSSNTNHSNAGYHYGCSSDLDCSLNGICSGDWHGRSCICDKPWKGASCGELEYAITPATAKSIFDASDKHNTWNGPIVFDSDEDLFHIYVPIYRPGSLFRPKSIKHGTAKVITGPWNWTALPDIKTYGENPAMVKFVDPDDNNKTVYSLWEGGVVRISNSPYGPFEVVEGFGYPGGNPAPIYHEGAFYLTNQRTEKIYTTSRLVAGNKWKVFADIKRPSNFPKPPQAEYHVEDPYLWVDSRGNWHIINHAYDNLQYENCGSSTLSAHFFSKDGKDWHWTGINPYSHLVEYDDGTSHLFVTLERPNLYFDHATGQLTHINLAADLVTGDEGCANRTKHAHFGHTPCDNCKWDDHAGTIVIFDKIISNLNVPSALATGTPAILL